MKFTHYIVAVLSFIAMTACTAEDMKSPTANMQSEDVVKVIGRVTRFTDHDVTGRAAKEGDEGKITSIAMAIFQVKDDGTGLFDGNCKYYAHSEEGGLTFNIDRSSDGLNIPKNKRFAIYVFANIPGMKDLENGASLETMLKISTEVKGIDIPENGFPMIGSLGDTFSTSFDKDGEEFILAPTSNGNDNGDLVAPTVGGVPQNVLTIPMKALYAKMNFTISVRPDQQAVEGKEPPKFTLLNYQVKNVPNAIDSDNDTNPDGASYVITSCNGLAFDGSKEASGANTINFSFYLPERYLDPEGTFEYPFEKGTYSTQVDSDQNGYRDEDEKYMQRYKCMLLREGQYATNIVISGRYLDHQNHQYDVDYTIYLGKDNYGNFDILRNYEYNNYITIRGIQTTNDMSGNNSVVSIDYRVNVTRTQPAIISLRRETLLDSHFEVRPLRVIPTGEGVDNEINAVRIMVKNPTTTDWMRLERSAGVGTTYAGKTNASGESIYITADGASKGKRRYFTHNLVTGDNKGTYDYPLNESHTVDLPLAFTEGENPQPIPECCWIYVDENLAEGDDVRTGEIIVTYGKLEGTEFTPTSSPEFPKLEYVINQRNLFNVTYDNRSYNIEYHEEYLHNYDAEDDYGQTDYEGMQWGLPNTQLSYTYPAIYLETSGSDNIFDDWGGNTDEAKNAVIQLALKLITVDPKYDFYLTRDNVNTNLTRRDHAGYAFSSEIIQHVNGKGNYNNDNIDNIDILALNKKSNSAIEYCYNKNKRNAEGHVVWEDESKEGGYNVDNFDWYLPSIDEIEEIVQSEYESDNNAVHKTYARFIEFQNKFYWSSQPSYIPYYLHFNRYNWYPIVGWGDRLSEDVEGYYYIDDTENARATKVNIKGKDAEGNDVIEIPSSAASTHKSYKNGIFYLSNGVVGSDKKVNKTLVLGQENIENTNYHNILEYPGNMPRTTMARVRCVRISEDKKAEYLE